MTHPVNLRQWHRDNAKVSLPVDLQDTQAEKVVTAKVDQRTAEKVSKLVQRAASGDEGMIRNRTQTPIGGSNWGHKRAGENQPLRHRGQGDNWGTSVVL